MRKGKGEREREIIIMMLHNCCCCFAIIYFFSVFSSFNLPSIVLCHTPNYLMLILCLLHYLL